MNLKKYIELEKKAPKGLMGLEWIIIAYTVVTLLLVLFGMTKLHNPDAMIWGRVRMASITLGMWVVFRLVPCRLTRLLRVVAQLAMLSWWYSDTYLLNCLFPNLDHVFARAEQSIFGFQPALTFCEDWPQIWMSELMDMAYASYFPIIAAVTLYYFFQRYKDFERAAFIILASFFAFYLIYDILPVTGPMYYYKAVGLDQIAKGVFPNVHDYFCNHMEMLPSPGYKDGIFYQLVAAAHNSGERPTAAFPSSHVGISVVCLLLAWRSGSRKLFFSILPFATLICLATVYIRAHYAIDVFAGLLFGIAFYLFWSKVYKEPKRGRASR
ncbi:MAG: phosphatase PAP2 family protein [Prevotella sp.]|nr:phosphatase PAP2 family protein [Prevotella sp.]